MRSISGQHIKSLEGQSRHILVQGDQAVVFEKQKGRVSVHICELDGLTVRNFFSFDGVQQDQLCAFLSEGAAKRDLIRGVRIGPMFRHGQTRRIVILKKKERKDAFFIKVEELTEADSEWTHNGSGWVPMATLDQRSPGMVVFVNGVREEDLIKIAPRYTQQGIFFLREHFEVYVEAVKKRYAFGQLVPRDSY